MPGSKEGLSQELRYSLGSWHSDEGPLYLLLADAIQRAVQRGELPLGSRLPAERPLADALSISRTTVKAAYETLRQREVVARRRGAGTYVGYYGGGSLAARGMVDGLGPAMGYTQAKAEDGDVEVDLSSAVPLAAPFTADDVLACQLVRVPGLLQEPGYFPLGYPQFREAIADHFTRAGLATSVDQIVVTTGAQQALYLCAQLLVRPGDLVLVEDPTWMGAIDAYRAARARMVGALIDEDGPRLAEYFEAVGRERVTLFHVSPTVHNPTGTIMSQTRRHELVAAAERNSTAIVEDNTLADLAFGPVPPPLASFDTDVPVFTIGSLSKVAWGGLRLGWIRTTPTLAGRLARMKLTADYGGPVIEQVLGTMLLERIETLGAQVRESAQMRLSALEASIREQIPDWTWSTPQGGLSLWVTLPLGDAGDFAALAATRGVKVVAGPILSPTARMTRSIRLSFTQPPEMINEGVRRLALAWSEYSVNPHSGRQPLSVVG